MKSKFKLVFILVTILIIILVLNKKLHKEPNYARVVKIPMQWVVIGGRLVEVPDSRPCYL